MKKFKWDEEKNKLLKKERGVSCEEILNSTFLGAEKHQTRKNRLFYYSSMKIMFG